VTLLNGAAECAALVTRCPIRYVLADDLTRLCTELAYSRGARNLACADLLHVPAQLLWVEWCNGPWRECLERYGFRETPERPPGRCGALIRASADGRRGVLRTLWSDGTELGALASSIESYFDLDTDEGEEPEPPDTPGGAPIRVYDSACRGDDVLARCFRFRFARRAAAPSAGLRAPQSLAREIPQARAARARRSAGPGAARVSRLRPRRVRHHPARPVAPSPCAGISCVAAAASSGGSPTCAAVRAPARSAPAPSPGPSTLTETERHSAKFVSSHSR